MVGEGLFLAALAIAYIWYRGVADLNWLDAPRLFVAGFATATAFDFAWRWGTKGAHGELARYAVAGIVGGSAVALSGAIWHAPTTAYTFLMGISGGALAGVGFGWSNQLLRTFAGVPSRRTRREIAISWALILALALAFTLVLVARPRAA